MRFSRLFIVFIILATAACANTTLRHRADYETTLQKGELLILPTTANVRTLDISGGEERMYEFESFLENNIPTKLKEVLEARGYRAKILTKQQMKDKKIYRDVDRLREEYKEKHKELRAIKNNDIEKARNIDVNLRKHTDPLAKATRGSVIIITDYVGTHKTAGARARDFAIDMGLAALGVSSNMSADAEKSLLSIGLVDGKNGNILWDHASLDMRDWIVSGVMASGKEEQEVALSTVADLISTALKGLPNKEDLGKPKE